ncbi:Elf1-domain-containing protein [Metschnikowia bicuspidata var. bicuspidata NRRL YB-4993]|uniref:Transcription elongation factor 1 homolog n=1 Tax=Metschnikowia bicuspidata var. bicuspidata NRRL YB-4993 TaxID=869754 RepID=A0A1A0HDZ3_9ASCO|nr:Elf1-domain-containing protein [Metschnikowia bicuspidata var. bicuspidata NRRL YB-4993]OBA22200.1 Elf1-domain-containing protein [Metschnikowia bicuspidata var. bicuspidata NRRL YB-4993]
MGKRKTAAKPVKKVKQKLDISFRCLFCNHEKSVICTMDKRNGIGDLHCKICGQSFQTAINSLSHPVDIYSDWIDACEDLAEDNEAEKSAEEAGESVKGQYEYSDDDGAPPAKKTSEYSDDEF